MKMSINEKKNKVYEDKWKAKLTAHSRIYLRGIYPKVRAIWFKGNVSFQLV